MSKTTAGGDEPADQSDEEHDDQPVAGDGVRCGVDARAGDLSDVSERVRHPVVQLPDDPPRRPVTGLSILGTQRVIDLVGREQ